MILLKESMVNDFIIKYLDMKMRKSDYQWSEIKANVTNSIFNYFNKGNHTLLRTD